jgi:hypothetical protein
MRKEVTWREYFSQLSDEELFARLVVLLEADASKTEPLAGAIRAVEAVGAADELKRRGVRLEGPEK